MTPSPRAGSEATVKIAKRDLVPTDANLRDDYASFAELVAACDAFCETGQRPAASRDRPGAGRDARRGAAPGCTCCPPRRTPRRWVRPAGSTTTRPIRFGLGALLDPRRPPGRRGVVPGGRRRAGHRRPQRRTGLVEIARHELSTPGPSPHRRRALPAPPGRQRPQGHPSPGRAATPKRPSWRWATAPSAG